MKLTFRPHHFLCTLGFQGEGYSPSFVENFGKITETLRKDGGDATEIAVVEHTDSVCAPCPHRRGKLCETQGKIDKLDQAHGALLRVSPGDRLTWGEAKQRIADSISLEDFDRICAPCEWQALGVCRKALEALKTSHKKGDKGGNKR